MDNSHKPHEDIFGIDKYSMQTLQSLLDKYSKDYLGFFYNLSVQYPEGSPRNKEFKDILILVDDARDLLKTIIASGSITDEDVKKVTDLSNAIEKKKYESLEGVEKTQELQEKLEKVAEKTGLSKEDQNITEEVTKTALQIARERLEQPSRLRRAAGAFRPAAGAAGRAAIKALPSIGLAALGPFYPLAKLLVKEEIRERRALKKAPRAAELQPEAGEADWGELNGAQEPDTVGRRQGRVVLDYSAALEHFFDKGGAYRARWTRELLASIQEGAGKKEGDLLGGLGGMGAAAGVAIPALLGALGAAFPILKMEKAYADYTEAVAGQYDALGNKLDAVILNYENLLRRIETFKKDTAETMQVVDPIMSAKKEQEELLKTMPEKLERDPFAMPSLEEMKRIKAGEKQPEKAGIVLEPFFKSLYPTYAPSKPEISSVGPRRSATEEAYPIPEVSRAEPSVAANLEQPIESLKGSIDNLANQVQENGVDGGKTPILGNMYDSGDVLLQEHAAGYLTLGR